MTQKIFDTDNEEDMKLLWNILPNDVNKIKKHTEELNHFYRGTDIIFTSLIKINWHDKTEITRPVNYEDMIGCVGWFSDSIDNKKAYIGILKEISEDGFKFKGELYDWWYSYFTPAKKSELKFYGD